MNISNIKTQLRLYARFILTFFFLIFSLWILEQSKYMGEHKEKELMQKAAQNTEAAFAAVKAARLSKGLPIDPLIDPNETGLIGESYTDITTTLGSLESKRTTTNPNTSAMVISMLLECGVEPGDIVAVNLSSSFPAMNLAVLCALDAIDAEGIVITSVGASTYGGNIPDFVYLDMEHVLLEQGLLQNHSLYFSVGGSKDIGAEMPEDIKASIIQRLCSYGLTFLNYLDLNENIAARTALYEQNGMPVCFINAGGNLLSFGGSNDMISARSGVLIPSTSTLSGNGLIHHYLKNGIPVIHLLNMKSLFQSYQLPYDPIPLPAAGEGDIYQAWHYPTMLTVFLFLCNAGLLYWAASHYPHKKTPF